eukprot:scaffold49560_cov20-Tisochrysis_lutea.AAC.1
MHVNTTKSVSWQPNGSILFGALTVLPLRLVRLRSWLVLALFSFALERSLQILCAFKHQCCSLAQAHAYLHRFARPKTSLVLVPHDES